MSSSSRAALSPSTSGSSSVPALLAPRPMRTSGVAKRERSVPMRRSQEAANSSAPPMQTPSIAAITGTGQASTTRVRRWNCSMVAAKLVLRRPRPPRTGRRRRRSPRPRRARRGSGQRRRAQRVERVGDRRDRGAAPGVAVALVVPADDAGAAELLGGDGHAFLPVSSDRVGQRRRRAPCGRPSRSCARRRAASPGGSACTATSVRSAARSRSRVGRPLDVDVQRRHDRVAVGDDRVTARRRAARRSPAGRR